MFWAWPRGPAPFPLSLSASESFGVGSAGLGLTRATKTCQAKEEPKEAKAEERAARRSRIRSWDGCVIRVRKECVSHSMGHAVRCCSRTHESKCHQRGLELFACMRGTFPGGAKVTTRLGHFKRLGATVSNIDHAVPPMPPVLNACEPRMDFSCVRILQKQRARSKKVSRLRKAWRM